MSLKKQKGQAVSLAEVRTLRNRNVRRSLLSTEERLSEVEQLLDRVVDHALELEERINGQGKFIRQILDRIKRHRIEEVAASTDASSSS
jgi:hypothetical protein